MAHEITNTDELFSVRQPTWHGLGHVLTDYPTRAEAQTLVHPWEPITEPLFTREFGVTAHEDWDGESDPFGERYDEVEGHKAVRRSDNGALLGVVGEGYEPVTNNEMWDIAESLQGEGAEVRFETGGSLKGGSKVWLLLRLNEPVTVKGDPHGATIPYYSLQNSHDGSGAFRGQATTTRIVCANTAHIADLDARARGTEFTFRHTKNVSERVEEARAALSGWRESLEEWKQINELLISEKFTNVNEVLWDDRMGNLNEGRIVDLFLEQFIPVPQAEVISDLTRNNLERERDKWRSIYLGVTGEGIRGTAYGLVQASVEYAEHFRNAHTQESRFKRAYLDRNRLVQKAVDYAKTAVMV